MRKSRSVESRVAEVGNAARAWHERGVVDAATLTAIEAAYPDERTRMATAWKVLIFVVTSVAVNAVFGVFVLMTNERGGFGPWLAFAVIFAGATEALLSGRRLGENGTAAATSFWSAVYAVAAAAFFFMNGPGHSEPLALTAALLVATLVFAGACWHWGFEAYGIFAAAAFFFLLARFPGGRLWWIVAGVLLIIGAVRELDRASLPPPVRHACAGVIAVSGLALYAAFNRYALDRRLIESVATADRSGAQPWLVLQVLSPLAMAAIPLLFIAWGLHDRRTLLVDLGAVLAALSLVTLRYYVHLAPIWLLLVVAGAGLILAALALNRRLRRAPNGEWAGFTARPLDSGRSVAGLGAAAVVASYAPDAAPAPGPREGGFTPGAGGFGGGGADGSF